jgi:poly(3-hydroxyalkanoate) depolymerase
LKIDLREVGGQTLRVGIRPGDKSRAPLLLFNGIGANIELVEPFLDILDGPEAIIFDVPGVGGSPAPRLPYRPWTLARLSAQLLDQLGHEQVDVLGVSWGGAIAQQFAFQQAKRCRRLILAATSPGHLMVPGKLAVQLKLASPRRYKDPAHMGRIAGEIYGGRMRQLARAGAKTYAPVRWSSDYGYYLQLMAGIGWSSLPWLGFLRQPTLVMAGNDDPIVPLANGRITAKLIPDARLVTLEDGHLFLLTSTQESAQLITEFLNSS